MRILLVGFGSRGDVQPLVPLGQGLQAAGFDVSIAAGVDFQTFVESAGLKFAPIHTNVQDLMNTATAKAWVEGHTLFAQAQNMRRVIEQTSDSVHHDLLTAARGMDILVSGLTSFSTVEAVAEYLKLRHFTIQFVPIHPTANANATMMPFLPRHHSPINQLAGYMAQYFTHWLYKTSTNRLRDSLNLKPFRFADVRLAYNQRVPILYGVSPRVMPRPDDWPAHIAVTGYWFHDAPADWQPSPALAQFLESGPPPIYIGFGSMSSHDPQAVTEIILAALARTQQRGIIHHGWAGLSVDDLPEHVLVLDEAPHDWLFPQMAAVVHHGGAGTTAAALRAGVPSTIVAHMGDQPYWGRRVHELGVGSAPIQRQRLTTDALTAAIQQMTSSTHMAQQAAELGAHIRAEDGVANAVTFIQRQLA